MAFPADKLPPRFGPRIEEARASVEQARKNLIETTAELDKARAALRTAESMHKAAQIYFDQEEKNLTLVFDQYRQYTMGAVPPSAGSMQGAVPRPTGFNPQAGDRVGVGRGHQYTPPRQ